MNDTLKFIKERFSCRGYTDQLPTDEQLDLIAQAAVQAPSGNNRQNWQVIVVKNPEIVKEMDNEGMEHIKKTDPSGYERMTSRGGNLFYNAPCMFMLAVKGDGGVDLGILAQNIAIAATSLGLASLHCGMVGCSFSGEKADYFKKKLKFNEGYNCGIAVLVGYAKNPGKPHEPDLSKITIVE